MVILGGIGGGIGGGLGSFLIREFGWGGWWSLAVLIAVMTVIFTLGMWIFLKLHPQEEEKNTEPSATANGYRRR